MTLSNLGKHEATRGLSATAELHVETGSKGVSAALNLPTGIYTWSIDIEFSATWPSRPTNIGSSR